MKEQIIYKKGANVWFIIAGILFLLRPVAIICENILNGIINYVSHDYFFILNTVFTRDVVMIFRTLIPALIISIIALILAIGSFVSKKTLVVMTVGFIINIVYVLISSLVSVISSIVSIVRVWGYTNNFVSIVTLILTNIGFLIIAFFILLALILMTISICNKFKKRGLSIAAAILYIVGTLVNILISIFGIFSTLLSGGMRKFVTLNIVNNIETIIMVTLVALPFVVYFLFAARRELPLITEEE